MIVLALCLIPDLVVQATAPMMVSIRRMLIEMISVVQAAYRAEDRFGEQ